MKILFTTSFYPPYHIGGDAVHVKYLAEAMARMGHEVHILHSMDAYEFKHMPKKDPEPPVKNITIHTMRSPLGRLEPILNFCLGTQRYTMDTFRRLVEKEKFDVVHHHNISLLGYGILKKIGVYTNLYTAHDYWLICHKYDLMKGKAICREKGCLACCLNYRKPYQQFRNTKSFKAAIGDVDRIIAPSQFMARSIAEEYPQVTVINNFIPEGPRPATSRIGAYFMFGGVVCENKGVFDLIEAFSRLDRPLKIAGSGDGLDRAREIIAQRRLKNIELLGWKNHEELFRLMASAQALIIPSIWPENNPLIGLESLYVGTPVIGSTWGGIPEIVGKIDKRLIFGDIDGLARIVARFDRKKYPSKLMQDIYSKNFSQEIFFRKYLGLIADLEK